MDGEVECGSSTNGAGAKSSQASHVGAYCTRSAFNGSRRWPVAQGATRQRCASPLALRPSRAPTVGREPRDPPRQPTDEALQPASRPPPAPAVSSGFKHQALHSKGTSAVLLPS